MPTSAVSSFPGFRYPVVLMAADAGIAAALAAVVVKAGTVDTNFVVVPA